MQTSESQQIPAPFPDRIRPVFLATFDRACASDTGCATTPRGTTCLSPVGIGTWGAASSDELTDAIVWALELGYRHIDTAWVYNHGEEAVGKALAKWKQQQTAPQRPPNVLTQKCLATESVLDQLDSPDVVITTKLWVTQMRPGRVPIAVQQSLKRMGVAYIDLLLIHWPIPLVHTGNDSDTNPVNADGKGARDEQCSVLETWRAMEDLVYAGLVHHIGLSNVNVSLIEHILANCRLRPAAVQNEMHPYLPQWDLVDYCKAHNIVLVAYSPLGSPGASLPSPPAPTGQAAPKLLDDPVISAIASRLGCTPAQVALSWAVQRGTCVIPKSTNRTRLEQNMQLVPLTPEDMAAIRALGEGTRWRCFDPRVLFGYDLFGEGHL